MGRHRKPRPEDPRPLHGYGLELENQRYVSYNYRINTIFYSVVFGPVLVLAGIGFAVADSDSLGDDAATLHWAGVLMALVGAAFFIVSLYLAIRALVHWLRHRKLYKAQWEAAVAEYEAREDSALQRGERGEGLGATGVDS